MIERQTDTAQMTVAQLEKKFVKVYKGTQTMAYKSDESVELYRFMARRGYPLEFCELISRQLNTTWTANRMLGYLRQLPKVSEEDIVDEMLGILSDRDRIRQKKEMEFYQSKINEMYMYGLGVDEE